VNPDNASNKDLTLGMFTTGDRVFPGCKMHSGKDQLHSGKLARVLLSGKRVRGSAPRGSRLPREPEIAHSGKASPRGVKALREEILFFQKKPKIGTVAPSGPGPGTVAPSGRPPATAPSSAAAAAVDPALPLPLGSAPSTLKEVAVVGGRHRHRLVP
jgi:hypothetical protein